MTLSQWTRLADLVPDALALAPGERDAFLDRACTGPDGRLDGALRDEAAALVRAADAAEASGALHGTSGWRSGEDAEAGAVLDERIGPWRVTGRLGEGGMGVVYAARRDDGLYERDVALKRLHPALAPSLAGRLDAERHTLARLEHPGVARLYDGGVDAHGAPYLVMERVDGVPITEHAAAAGLGVRERVALFVQVCEAVAYAHGRLVVHRDLKPSNVFVTPGGGPDGGPSVKLLDFGIAKLLDRPGEAGAPPEAVQTQGALTPSYAAPEQLTRGEITTATDVYALGVMLYELLADRRPYSLSGTTAAEAERIVVHTEPAAPSSVAPPERARALRGDLDTIVMKALAKEPPRRYASAESLAADLRRHLDGLPVEARPATAGYRTRRFVRRHRVGVAAAVLVAVAVVAGAAVALGQARVARAEAATAAAANEFLVGLLGAADPTADGRDVRVASLLDQASASLDSVFAGQPDVAAAMRHTLGVTYYNLGLFPEAGRELRRALATREQLHGRQHRDVVETQSELGLLRLDEGDLDAADSVLTLALASARAVLPAQDALTGNVLGNLAYVRFLEGDFDASLAMHREALAIQQAQPDPDPVEVAAGLGNIAIVLGNQGHPADAAATIEQQVAVYRAALEPTNTRIARALNNLGSFYFETHRLRDALRVTDEAIAIYRRAVGGDNAELAGALSNLAPVLLKLGRADESAAALEEALGLYRGSLGEHHPRYANALVKLGQVRQEQGRMREAEALLRQGVAILHANVPPTHPAMGNGPVVLGELLVATGRAADAVPLFREGLAAREAALPAGHPDRAIAASLLGDALHRTGQTAEARRLLASGHAALARAARADTALTGPLADASRRLAALRRTRDRE